MAWISSESFYRRLIRSQTHHMGQNDYDGSVDFKGMQEELESLIRERDELFHWKEAHIRKDSAVPQDPEDFEAKSQMLEVELERSQDECDRLRNRSEDLHSTLDHLKVELQEAKCLRESLNELQAAHDELKTSNEEIEALFAAVSRDLAFQAQAAQELERSRDDLQEKVDDARLETQSHKNTISRLVQDCTCREDKIVRLTSQLEEATEDVREMVQRRAELESRNGRIKEELRMQAALADQRGHFETELLELRPKYELACKKLEELNDEIAAERMARKRQRDGLDSISDGFISATLLLILALAMFGVVTGRLA